MKHYIYITLEGSINWIEKMPEEPDLSGIPSELYQDYAEPYEDAIDQAKAESICFEDQEVITYRLLETMPKYMNNNWVTFQGAIASCIKRDTIYPIELYSDIQKVKYSCNHNLMDGEIICPHSAEEFPDCCGMNKVVARIIPKKAEESELSTDELNALSSIGVVAKNWYAVSYSGNSMPYAIFDNKECAEAYRDKFSATSIVEPWPMVIKDLRKKF